MIYSRWNHADRQYDYFETPERSAATSAPTPAHLRPAKLGSTPEQAGWPLPRGAKPTGSGKYPKGYIVGNEAVGAFDLTPTNLLIYGGVGFLLWRWWSKKS